MVVTVEALKWENDVLLVLNQLKLPFTVEWVEVKTWQDGASVIKDMVVRGAPAIGVTAAYAYALGFKGKEKDFSANEAKEIFNGLAETRPTAVNLRWALERMERVACRSIGGPLYDSLVKEAVAIHQEDVAMNRSIGEHGLSILPPNARILTHCNAGALATGGYGTALGVIYSGFEAGLVNTVWVDETRPYLQGARLTAYELEEAGVPYTLVCDNMAGCLMAQRKVDLVLVGADRITSLGDVANKIGTYSLAVLCHYHGIPFYVAAPTSTIDMGIRYGRDIPIEQRPKEELATLHGVSLTRNQEAIYNPAFDFVPFSLITAIITDRGVVYPPFARNLAALMGEEPVNQSAESHTRE
jgi:methylthioribose-1-phosphate isomerase